MSLMLETGTSPEKVEFDICAGKQSFQESLCRIFYVRVTYIVLILHTHIIESTCIYFCQVSCQKERQPGINLAKAQ